MLRRKTLFLNQQTSCSISRLIDPSIERVDAAYHHCVEHDDALPDCGLTCRGYGPALGPALLNTTVSRLDLSLRVFFHEGHPISMDSAEPLLQFIRTSQSLRTLRLAFACRSAQYDILDGNVYRAIQTLHRRVLEAAAESTSLTMLSLPEFIPMEPFIHLLNVSRSITTIDLGDWFLDSNERYVEFDATSGAAARSGLVNALVTHPSLRRMRLVRSQYTEAFIDEYIQRLDALPSRNESLCIELAVKNVPSLRSAPPSCAVQTVSLHYTTLHANDWNDFCDNLRIKPSVTRLELHECTFAEEAAVEHFIKFVQTQANRNKHRVRDLYLTTRKTNGVFASMTFGQVISTVMDGSALCSLEIERPWQTESHWASFSYRVMISDSREQLRDYWMKSVQWDSEGPTVVLYLDKKLCTRAEFDALLALPSSNFDAATKLALVCRNGGLLYASVLDFADGTCLWNERQLLQIQATCQRNANLPVVVAALNASNDMDETNARLRLLPRLLTAARGAPTTSPTNMLSGIASLSDSPLWHDHTAQPVKRQRDL